MLFLVAYIRQQSDMSCSLDGNCQLTLVECTSACHSSGQDLGSFRHALLELVDVLVVNLLYTVNAEHANLLARTLGRTGISFTFHTKNLLYYRLKRYFAVTQNFFKIFQITQLDRLRCTVHRCLRRRCLRCGSLLVGLAVLRLLVILLAAVLVG